MSNPILVSPELQSSANVVIQPRTEGNLNGRTVTNTPESVAALQRDCLIILIASIALTAIATGFYFLHLWEITALLARGITSNSLFLKNTALLLFFWFGTIVAPTILYLPTIFAWHAYENYSHSKNPDYIDFANRRNFTLTVWNISDCRREYEER